MYHYWWTNQARHQIKKLDPDIQRIIIKKLDYFLTIPNPLSLAKRMTRFEGGQYRFRISDYRVTFDAKGQMFIILAIGHRSEIYKK